MGRRNGALLPEWGIVQQNLIPAAPILTQRRTLLSELRTWQARRWLFAALTAGVTVLLIAIPTAMIPTGIFGREIPPTPWSWPVLIVTSVLTGLLAATYVARKDTADARDRPGRLGTAGAFVTFFAVGCPVCNKLVLLALGYTGAIQFFEPIQPYLAVGAIALLGWALHARITKEAACPLEVAGDVSN